MKIADGLGDDSAETGGLVRLPECIYRVATESDGSQVGADSGCLSRVTSSTGGKPNATEVLLSAVKARAWLDRHLTMKALASASQSKSDARYTTDHPARASRPQESAASFPGISMEEAISATAAAAGVHAWEQQV